MLLSSIASLLECDFKGTDIEIVGMNTLKDAKSDEVSFVANSKYIKDIKDTKAGAIIISPALLEHVPRGCVSLEVEHSYWSMATLSKQFAPAIEDENSVPTTIGNGTKISDKAEIAKGVTIGKNCTILAHVYIGSNVVIGDNTIIYPNVTIYRDCKVGSDCIIHANSVIGSDGFGFASNALGEHKKIYQNGNVVLEDDIEMGSNSSIDRAVFGTTLIKKGVRIDNLVQIGHNCEIGEYSVVAGQAGIAGSAKLGRSSIVGAQSGIAGHLEIAPFNTFAARTGVTKSIKESGKVFAGFPFMEHRAWLKIQGKIAKLIKN